MHIVIYILVGKQKLWFMFVATDCQSHQKCEYAVEVMLLEELLLLTILESWLFPLG